MAGRVFMFIYINPFLYLNLFLKSRYTHSIQHGIPFSHL